MVRIFADIHSVRAGVSASFKKSDVQAISASVLWATFKTHDAMAVFSKSKFKDHPAASSEYVKFLASNTGMESVSKFTDALKRMGAEVKEAAVKSSNATKQVLIVSNKVDEVKAKLLTLERRLSKLESK
jgi:tRNA(Phe) wybutosine-synthesizing methylase Tyw3